jgi:transcriptional regulator with XRE-family HTH domain
MTTIGERFSQLIESLGMNESSFAKTIDKSRSMIGLVVNGKSKPGFDFLELVCLKFPQVSRDWLLAGEGEMFRSEQANPPLAQNPDNYLHEHLHTLEGNFARLAAQLQAKDHQLETKDHQIEAKDSQIANLQEMLKMALVGKPNGVAAAGSVIRVHPATQQIVEPVGATA